MKKLFLFALGFLALTSCNQIKPEKTIEDLKASIKGETTASAKYAAFADKAREEGYQTIAKLFEATSKAEFVHAENHKKVLTFLNEKMDDFTPAFEVTTTADMLQNALDGETYEVITMYPQFLVDAKAEKVDEAKKSFTWAFDTEKKHQEFYANALEALKTNNTKTLATGYVVCPVCGNTYKKGTEDAKCTFCQTSKEKFISI